MRCRYPLFLKANEGLPVPCGQCMPCRIKRRRLWTSRLLLEALSHSDVSFVTLTYADNPITLWPRDVQLWIKRLRKRYIKKLRYYLVGEYGSISDRPHYHAILFGFSSCLYGRPIVSSKSNCPCLPCSELQSSWPHGFTYNGTFSRESAQYVSGYVIKRMTSKKDLRLQGRHPEFSRMSRCPGIGALAMQHVAKSISKAGLDHCLVDGDIPTHIKMDGKSVLFGPYLRDKLRHHLDLPPGTPQANVDKYRIECLDAIVNAALPSPTFYQGFYDRRSEIFSSRYKGVCDNIEARYKIFNSGGSL